MSGYGPGAVLAERYADPARNGCEDHDTPGECTQECLDLVWAMGGDGHVEPMVYGDYLGGTWVGIDPSGCHRGPSVPTEEPRLDTDRRRIVFVNVHPEDCQCDKPECPAPWTTLVWCATRNGYADDQCVAPETHVHYDVEIDDVTGRVLTSAAEQAERRRRVSDDRRLWHEVTVDLLHANRGPIYKSAEFLRDHPAMRELLRRAKESNR